jgi:hypothetical protein
VKVVVDSQRLEKLVPWRQTAVMTSQWRLVNASGGGDPQSLELYNIRQDPGQRQNVASQNPQVVQNLKAQYNARWKEISRRGEEFVRISWEVSPIPCAHLARLAWRGRSRRPGIRRDPAGRQ